MIFNFLFCINQTISFLYCNSTSMKIRKTSLVFLSRMVYHINNARMVYGRLSMKIGILIIEIDG